MPINTAAKLQGFPDAGSTGVRSGTSLKQVGDLTVTQDGAVISGLEIHGTLRIEANNVTVRDCKLVSNGEYHAILIPDGVKGAVVEYSDIIGGTNGISGAGTFRYNDFSHNDNGINVYGPSLISDNYIHDMSSLNGEPHFDGIEINGGGGTTIRHNTIINDSSQTSAVMIDNYFGAVSNIIVDNNYLAGGGYTIYSDGGFNSSPVTGVEITNNYLGEGYWGYYAFKNNNPLVSGNHELGRDWPTPVSGGDNTPIPDPTPNPEPTPVPPTANDVLKGTTGADILKGGLGDDTYVVNNAGDKIIELYDQGRDIVQSSVDFSLKGIHAEELWLTGSGAIKGTGNSLDNLLIGNDSANQLDGRAGDDILNGWGGADTLTGGDGHDTFSFTSQFSADGDLVRDFTSEDILDFSKIDASGRNSGDQRFIFDGYAEDGGDGHIWVSEDRGGTHVHGQVDGYEFQVNLAGTGLRLTSADLVA